MAVLGRKIGPAVERHALGSEKHGHGPAAAARHRLHGLHVDLVDVGPLLTIHLDVHEELVHERGDLLVLEGLALHDVAPVARRVTDGQQQGLVFGAGALEGLRAPRIPVHRVVTVLEEVGARLTGEAVGVLVLGHWKSVRPA